MNKRQRKKMLKKLIGIMLRGTGHIRKPDGYIQGTPLWWDKTFSHDELFPPEPYRE